MRDAPNENPHWRCRPQDHERARVMHWITPSQNDILPGARAAESRSVPVGCPYYRHWLLPNSCSLGGTKKPNQPVGLSDSFRASFSGRSTNISIATSHTINYPGIREGRHDGFVHAMLGPFWYTATHTRNCVNKAPRYAKTFILGERGTTR
jgi:hypothetical protein